MPCFSLILWGFVMRIRSVVLLAAAFGAAEAHASSILIAAPLGNSVSISPVGAGTPADQSIIPAMPEPGGNWPSISVLTDTPHGQTPSIVTLGEPADPEDAVATPAHRTVAPVVFRGGEAGPASVRPPTASGSTQAKAPLLDPNDRGTASKRKALKRQAEQIAQQRASGTTQSEPSTEAVPFGN